MWKKVCEVDHKVSIHSASCFKSKIYIFGGYQDGSNKTFNDFYEFQLDTKIWRKLETSGVPSDRMGHCSVIWNDKLYIFGGWRPDFSASYLDEIFQFDFTQNLWTKVEFKTKLKQLNRCYHSGDIYNNSLYIFGGWNGFYRLNELLLFAFELNSMKRISSSSGNVPCGRSGHSSVIYDDYLYIYGGMNQEGERMNDLHHYDIMNKKWKKISIENNISPIKASGSKLIHFKENLYLFGGSHGGNAQYFSSNSLKYLGDFWKFNLISNKWSKIEDKGEHPSGRSFYSMCLNDNKIVIYGGVSETGYSGEVFEYQFEQDFRFSIWSERIFDKYINVDFVFEI
jgi:N-acetylneuraminic acid mutarotase